MSDRITESIGATEESGDEGSIDRKQVGIPSAEFRSPNDCNFDIVVINHTPIINPGDSIELDVYISGHRIPSKNQLHISYNRSLIDESEPGEVRTYVNLSPGKVKYSPNLPALDVDVPTKMEQKKK